MHVVSAKLEPDIQGLRGVAVIAVIAFHAGLPIPGGFTGVDVFFVISGFVISRILFREFESSEKISLRNFYWRRLKRLGPALAVMLVCVLVLSVFILSPLGMQQTTALTAMGAVLLSSNIVLARSTGGYFDLAAAQNPLTNVWSLSVEEQFYLVFPLVFGVTMVLAVRRRLPEWFLILIIASFSLVSFFSAVVGSMGFQIPMLPDYLFGFYSPVTRAWEFGVGVLIFLSLRYLPSQQERLSLGLRLFGTSLIFLSFFFLSDATPFPSFYTLIPVVGAASLILAARVSAKPKTGVLTSKPLVLTGNASYSLYLWHWPVIVLFQAMIEPLFFANSMGLICGVLAGILSYVFIEQKYRRAQLFSASLKLFFVFATVAVPLMVALSVLYLANIAYGMPSVAKYVNSIVPSHAGVLRGCAGDSQLNVPVPDNCWWNVEAEGPPIFLVGDSNAEHFSESVIGAGIALNRPVNITTQGGCPYADIYLMSSTDEQFMSEQCRLYYETTQEWLSRQQSGTVIISSSGALLANPDLYINSKTNQINSIPEQNVEEYIRGAKNAVDVLQKMGHNVVLVKPAPRYSISASWDPQKCSLLQIASTGCSVQVEQQILLMDQDKAYVALNEIARGSESKLLDLSEFGCSGGKCSTETDAGVLYRDADHISVPGALTLVDDFVQALE